MSAWVFLCETTQKEAQIFLTFLISKKQREGEELMVNGGDTKATLTVVVPISYGPFKSMLR